MPVAWAGDEDPHAKHRASMSAPSTAGEARIRFPHADLVGADGRAFDFSTDAFGDRVVIIDFVYTTCTTICPALTAVMAGAERRLQAHLGDKVVLVSVTVDPERDTPQAMRAFSERVRAGTHWHWLTGRPAQVNRILRGFGLTPGTPEAHPPVLLIGRPAQGRWLRWVGIPTVPAVVDETLAMIAESAAAASNPTGGTSASTTQQPERQR